ncbi:porin [Bradyrhizobium sp. USDA 3315]
MVPAFTTSRARKPASNWAVTCALTWSLTAIAILIRPITGWRVPRLGNAYTSRSRGDLNIDTRTETEYGTLRTFFETGLIWTDGTYSGAGTRATVYSSIGGVQAPNNANSGAIAGGTVGVYSLVCRVHHRKSDLSVLSILDQLSSQ